MSKFSGVLGCAAVGTGTSVGGAYLMGAFYVMDATLPKTLDDFKKGNVGDCVKQYFPGFDVTKATSGTSLDLEFTSTGESEIAKSCLVVNWERQNYSVDADHGKGNFRGLGSFVKGNKGFVMFNVASTSTTNEKELDLKGVLYVLNKDDTSNIWTSNNSKDASATKKLTKDGFDDAFPKAADPMKSKFSDTNKQESGGFVKDKNEMNKLCKDGSGSKCTTSSGEESFKGLWTWESISTGTDTSLTTGSSNLDKGVPNLYSGATDLKSKLTSFKGKGNEPVVFEKSPKTQQQAA